MKVQRDFQTFASKTKTRDANLNFLYQTCSAMIEISYFWYCYFLIGWLPIFMRTLSTVIISIYKTRKALEFCFLLSNCAVSV